MGPNGIGSQRDGGRQSQGVTGSCRGMVPPKLSVSAAMGSRTYRAMRSSWVMAHVGLRLRAPPLGHRDAQSPLRMK